MRYSWLPMSLLVAAFLAFVGTAVGASLSLDDLIDRDAERSDALRTQTGVALRAQSATDSGLDAAQSGLRHPAPPMPIPLEPVRRHRIDIALVDGTDFRHRIGRRHPAAGRSAPPRGLSGRATPYS